MKHARTRNEVNDTRTHTHIQRERERERERERDREILNNAFEMER